MTNNKGETPLYKKIKEWIKEEIKEGKLQQGDQLPTELELAEMFDVSRITSKRALEDLKREGIIHRKRGQGSFVSRSNLSGPVNKSKIISLIIPYETTKGKLINYIKGASDVLAAKGYFLTIHCTDYDPKIERNLLKKLPEGDLSGILLYPINSTDNIDILYKLQKSLYPLVTLDKWIDGVELDSVISDNREGSRKAVAHLIEGGHKQIAFISSVSLGEASSVKERYFGYCDALLEAGLEVDSDNVLTDFHDQLVGCAKEELPDIYEPLVREFISRGCTAFVIENDYIAFDVLDTFRKLGVDIPGEVSVIGFDNVEKIESVDWELTTIDQNIYEIGRHGAEILIGKIEKGIVERKQEVIPVELIVRDTTGAAPSEPLKLNE